MNGKQNPEKFSFMSGSSIGVYEDDNSEHLSDSPQDIIQGVNNRDKSSENDAQSQYVADLADKSDRFSSSLKANNDKQQLNSCRDD